MVELKATAVRNGKSIEVLVTGFLNDSCHKASIVDIYPGGNIVYIVDPGVAQVFIEETSKQGSSYCLLVLVPWAETITIPDRNHDQVEIYLNKQEKLQIPVLNEASLFVVCELSGFNPNPSCSIVPEGMCNLGHPFRQVFGPATYQDCYAYKNNNCP